MENYTSNQLYTMQLNNKQFSIFPLVDHNNVLSQEPIYDKNGNFIKYLSNFRYIETNIDTKEFRAFNILVDLDINLYNNDMNYRNAIYTQLLSFNRINKICDEYHRYAGGLYLDSNTYQYQKYVEQDIIDSLKHKEQVEEKHRLSIFQKNRQAFLKRTASKPIHIKDSHAEVLTQDMYQKMYGTNSIQYQDSFEDER